MPRGLSRRLHDNRFHDLRHHGGRLHGSARGCTRRELTTQRNTLGTPVVRHLLARLRCAVRLLVRCNGKGLTVTFRFVEALGRNLVLSRLALLLERLVLGSEALILGLHDLLLRLQAADLLEDLLLERSMSRRGGRDSLLRARFTHRHVLLGEFEHPRPYRARGLDGAESSHSLLDAVGCASR